MEKNYTVLHLHSDDSNPNMIECINTYKQYIDKAVGLGMKSICFTEHGLLTGWYNKKVYAEENSLKYLHGIEAYVTETLDEKIRDNYHMTLIARNLEGFKELNILSSKSFNREDNSYYYNPRIPWSAIKNTSDNIIILTACLGGIIPKMKRNDNPLLPEVEEWFIANKERVFLEVQNHDHPEQIEYNKYLKDFAVTHDMKLVGTGDFHSLDVESDDARKIIQKAKGVQFTDEDSFKLHFKDYEEMFGEFTKQEMWTEDEIHEFMNQTNIIADMVSEFKLDYSNKYPKMSDNGEAELKKRIVQGIRDRGIHKFPKEEQKIYRERIQYELDTYKANGAMDYLLLEDMVKTFARDNDIDYGYGRGSVTGSIVAYLMKITHVDSIKRKLSFERFMSKDRVSLADVDSDYPKEGREMIQKFLMGSDKFYSAPIMTSNTLGDKSAIKLVGKGLDMDLSVTEEISKNYEGNPSFYEHEYPELFKYVKMVIGITVSVGQHPAGILVSPFPIDENMGTFTTTESIYPLTVLNMKEIDAQNWVKLDVLGLDTVEIIGNTCKLAGIDFVDPQNLDPDDEAVWESIKTSNVSVFQWESDFSKQIYDDLFSKETIAKIKARNPDFAYMDLFSLGNAILRPSGASYRGSVVRGEFYDNGHEALNTFLSSTLGRLVYQEQLIFFLVEFCGYTAGHADIVRRGVGKKSKEIMDKEIPLIEQKFIETMVEKYDTPIEEATEIAKPFIQVFIDSANYGFSINHSESYSWMGYACAWLKYYYPLEFVTSALNALSRKKTGNEEKVFKLIEYAESVGIAINPIKFRYSRSGYAHDKETNSIYQGIKPLKTMNDKVGEDLYKLRSETYNSFIDFLVETRCNGVSEYLTEKYSDDEIKLIDKDKEFKVIPKYDIDVGLAKIITLIKLNYFSEFGGNAKLLKIAETFDKRFGKTLKLKTKRIRYQELVAFEKSLEDESLSIVEQCSVEFEFLGHAISVAEDIDKRILLISEMKVNKANVRFKAYQFATGEQREFKITTSVYRDIPFKEMDVIQLLEVKLKNKRKNTNGGWQEVAEKEPWITSAKFIRKG